MHILTVPEDTARLRVTSEPVAASTPELINFLKNLGETLKNHHHPDGVGLSAIQVGRPLRVFATLLPQIKQAKPTLTFYVNPVITGHAAEMTLGEDLVKSSDHPSSIIHHPFLEGCLSIPDLYGPVLRWPWIRAKAFVLTEQTLSPNSDFPARHRLSRHGGIAGGRIQNSEFTLEALDSRVFQHELDHLNGILFTDHTLAQGGQLYRETRGDMVPVRL